MPAHLARLLVEGGVLNRSQADERLRRHLQVGGSLDTVLLEAGAVREDLLLGYLASASGLPGALAHEFAAPDPKLLQLFPYKLAERHGMAPIAVGKRHLDVAAIYPVETLLLEELSFMLGRDLKPRVAVEVRVREAVARLYHKPLPERFGDLLRKLGPPPTQIPDLTDARAAPAPRRYTDHALGRAAQVGSIAAWPPPGTTLSGAPAIAPPRNELATSPRPEAEALPPIVEATWVADPPGEVDAAEFLPDDVPEPAEIVLSVEPEPAEVVLSVEPEPAEMVLSVEPEPAPNPLEVAPPLPAARPREHLVFEPAASQPAIAPAPELLVVEPELPEPAPLEVAPAPEPLEPAPAAAMPSTADLARPDSQGLIDSRAVLSTWRPGDVLGTLDEAMADALVGLDVEVHAPEPVEVPIAEPPSAPRGRWTLSDARAQLAAAPGRDAIIEVALRFALKSFDFAAALAVRSGAAFGWAAITPDRWDEQVHRVALPLDAQSVLRTVLRAQGRYLGPLPEDPLTRQLLRDLGREWPLVALIFPVFVRERPVAIFYADRGRKHVAAPRVAEFLLFAQELATAFERAIVLGKKRPLRVVAESPLLPSVPSMADLEPAFPARSDAPAALEVEPADDQIFPAVEDDEPAFAPTGRNVELLIADLLGTDRRRRLGAMTELATLPELAAPALAAIFPGPTALRRGLVVDLPDPEELGPVIGAMARLKRAAVPYVERLLREGSPDQRFFAVLLAGGLQAPALFPGVLRSLFDPVPEVSAAARAAAGGLRMLPGFEEGVARQLRGELASSDPDRVASAALALGRTRDTRAIPLLIPLAGHANDRVAAETSDALTQITKQTHGDSPRRWTAWWEQNKNRPRVTWLVDGLAHKDLQMRLASIEELVEITSDSFGYLADGPRREREKALSRWDAWLAQRVG